MCATRGSGVSDSSRNILTWRSRISSLSWTRCPPCSRHITPTRGTYATLLIAQPSSARMPVLTVRCVLCLSAVPNCLRTTCIR
ncbi:hypothetical protein ATCV1_z126R [Acanthocystis turfacea chlorella virus 1]|uniref:Uncharacterized protein z126R n=1 Tax=Chlorovirus heliozoae TaxID=322019 RepID=A7K886_9PHYC|nr:hypothetical protein ATCV1_z126R [Acanthocystis turfacea chlorella virus 1]ABT16260.1 hypothetical protein ATCV1_z126R [Acanthocystis turfacea chlorella virus 1]